jgi:hypothetical protein
VWFESSLRHASLATTPVGLTKFTRLQALQEQQAAAAAALEALPSVDIVHKSLMNTFQSDMLHMVSTSWPFLESR